jgi:hypothetical protein
MEMNHLSDEQWDKMLMPDSSTSEHLSRCEACRNQSVHLQNLLAGLADSARAASEQPDIFWERQLLSVQRRLANLRETKVKSARLAWAAVLALVLIASFVLRTGSRVPVQPNVSDSDRELLVQVQEALDGDVPQALQPASLIAHEIDQAAQPRSNSTSSKEKSEHED